MADRRRRKCPLSDVSDCGSDESGDEQIIKTTSNPGIDIENSEYESAEEEELSDEDEQQEAELQNGPGEPRDLKPLDHDEDRKNPQYIPKRGTFYEHDDRTMGEDENVDSGSEKAPPSEKELKKKVWKEDGKWQHDRFSMYDQSPKSREELVATYGYDIRNEEGPPRARRRRRYGRGPNKYTRNWEDVDAYSKPTRGRVAVRGGKGRAKKNIKPDEEFSSLSSRDETEIQPQESVTVETPQVEPSKGTNVPVTAPSSTENIRSLKSASPSGRGFPEDTNLIGLGRGIRNSNWKGRPGTKGHQGNQNFIDGGQYPARIRGENVRGRGEGKGRGSGRGGHTQSQTSPHLQKEVQEVAEEFKSITITVLHKEDHHYKNKRGGMDNRRNTIPPRLQETMKGNKSPNHAGGDSNSSSKPKRYSSQRQRPLQDQVGQYHHSQGYFDQNSTESGYANKMYERTNSSPGAIPASQLSLPGPAPPTFVAPSFTTTASAYPPAPRLFPPATQPHLIGPSVPGPPIGGPPPVAGPPVPGTVGGPPVTGPPFLPPENMINYAAGAPTLVAPPHAPQFPAFQAFTPVSQQQPAEIYSNGVMYYNTQSQQHLPRINPVLQKRPKAAIPIVPPPDKRQTSTTHSEREQQRQEYEDLESTGDSYDDACNDRYHDEVVESVGSPSVEAGLETTLQTYKSEKKSLPNQPAEDKGPLEIVDSTSLQSGEEAITGVVTSKSPPSEDEPSLHVDQERMQEEGESSSETLSEDFREVPTSSGVDSFQNGEQKEAPYEMMLQEETKELDTTASSSEKTTTNLEESETKSPSVTDLVDCKEITEQSAVTT